MGGLREFWDYIITDPKKAEKEKKKREKKLLKEHPELKEKIKNQKIQEANIKDQNNNNISLSDATTSRKLSSGVLLFILINSILGSSLFYLPSLGMISSGPASIIAWVAVFLLAAGIMLYIGELLGMLPSSGGTYYFCKRAYPRGIAFMGGWLIWLAGNLGMALNIVAAAEYFIPEAGMAAFWLRVGFSALWIVALNYMAYRGIDAGASMLVAFGFFSILVVTMFIVPSFIDLPSIFSGGGFSSPFQMSHFTPFFTHAGNIGIFTHLLLSIFLIMEAFFGFEAITYMANEAKDSRELPKLLFKALGICAVLILLVIITSIATVSYTDYISDARPWALQALNTLGSFGQQYIVFGMYLVIIGAAAAWPIASSRLLQAMAKDKLFPTHFAKLHPKHNSPHRAVIFQTIMISIFTWFIFQGTLLNWSDPYRTTYLIYVLIALLVLSLVIMAVPRLREKEANLERPFIAPWPKLGPILLVLFFAVLVGNWIWLEGAAATSIISLAISFILLGIPLYFIVEMYYNPKAINQVNEVLSYFAVLAEKLHLSSPVHKKVLEKLIAHGSKYRVKNRVIMEYGCGIGTLTKELAKLVGPSGHVVAIDTSKHNVAKTKQATKDLPQVHTLHDETLDDFKLNLPLKAHHFISIGMLSYMQKPKLIIHKISNQLEKGASIHIVDYDKFFWVIPNVEWIESDEELTNIFAEAGIKIRITKKHALLWTYIIIDGVKVK